MAVLVLELLLLVVRARNRLHTIHRERRIVARTPEGTHPAVPPPYQGPRHLWVVRPGEEGPGPEALPGSVTLPTHHCSSVSCGRSFA